MAPPSSGRWDVQPLDIEAALSWAYRQELPKRDHRRAFENAIEGPRLQPRRSPG